MFAGQDADKDAFVGVYGGEFFGTNDVYGQLTKSVLLLTSRIKLTASVPAVTFLRRGARRYEFLVPLSLGY